MEKPKFNGISAILIWSEDYEKLADWYKDKLGLTEIEQIHHPEDTGVGLSVGGFYLWIGKHSEVHGQAKDAHRIMFNISVDSVKETHEVLVNNDVECIAAPFKAPTFDKYFATFKDLDGNIFQIIGAM
ncbi:VOC family protein [candidate division WWE3 bacterium]|uniref:VOC family protein n=1 Tax=candidate division WWE3 bacterium TaxID=2053526 RepID=A0A955LK19_UNCKA|nr:VOC family protein [candidate division WWE3 bacterium]